MQLTRQQSIGIVIGVFLLFIVGTSALLKTDRALPTEPTGESPDEASETAPTETNAVILSSFTRKEVKDGKLIWQLHAEEGKMFPASNLADLKMAELTLQQKDGLPVTVKADKIQATFTAGALSSAHLNHHVEITQADGSTVKTEEAIFSSSDQKVIIPIPVAVTKDAMSVTANQAAVFLEKNIIIFKGNVVTKIRPKRSRS